MKLLFIDSNIFLNFYDFHDEDLNQLGKLVDLIKSGDIKLYLTSQVCDEIKRNREVRLRNAYGQFSESKAVIPMPVFCKHYEEYSDIKKTQKILDTLKSNLSKKLWKDIQEHKLKADQVIQGLIKESQVIDSNRYIDDAVKRHHLGKPPGKKDRTYGDEINWEALLAEVAGDGEFILISKDGDYASPVDENQLKDYLIDEWKTKKSKNEIFFYKSLGVFFRDHDIKIELRVEQEKDDLVSSLINSPSFLSTHNTISRLGKYNSFSDDQIKGLATALLENGQVGSIAKDKDVNEFYKKNLLEKSDSFEPDTWESVKTQIQSEEEGSVGK